MVGPRVLEIVTKSNCTMYYFEGNIYFDNRSHIRPFDNCGSHDFRDKGQTCIIVFLFQINFEGKK